MGREPVLSRSMTNNTDAGQHVLLEAEKRDALVMQLAGLASTHPDQLREAGVRLKLRVDEIIGKQRAGAAEEARVRSIVLDVAREIYLDSRRTKPRLAGDSSIHPDGPFPARFTPAGLSCFSRGVPLWMQICYERVGYFDYDVALKFTTYVKDMAYVDSGRRGEWTLTKKYDLKRMSGPEAYVALHATQLSHPEHGKRSLGSRDGALAEVTPEAAADLAADPCKALHDIVQEMLSEDTGGPLTLDDCWMTVLVTLFVLLPEFDGRHAGVDCVPGWDDEDPHGRFWRSRSFIREVMGGAENPANERKLCALARRAARRIEGGTLPLALESPLAAEVREELKAEIVGEVRDQVIKSVTPTVDQMRNEAQKAVASVGEIAREATRRADELHEEFQELRASAITVGQAREIVAASMESMVSRVEDHKRLAPKPHGWTKQDLCDIADISSGTFSQISVAAEVTRPKSGEHSYRFRHDELVFLIEAAERADGKRKWLLAAKAWRELLSRATEKPS